MSLHPSHDPGVWVGALLTLFAFSFLYRDNPLYRLAEHLFVGVSVGYYTILGYWTVLHPRLVAPLVLAVQGRGADPAQPGFLVAGQGDYRLLLLIPAHLGLLLLARLSSRIGWLSRVSLAVVIGVYAGLRTTGYAQADLVAQVQASVQPLWRGGDPGYGIGAIVFAVGLVSTLLGLVFTRERTGAQGVAARVGSGFLMIAFGAGFGFAAMSRLSLLVGRLQFLLHTWLGLG